MAKKFLTSIDLNHNELQYAVVHALATAPATGSTGQIYFNTSDNYLYQYYNSAWHAVGVPTPQNAYSLDAGSVSSNTVPIRLYENGAIKNTVNIKGAGGATITASNGTITITTANNNTTYTFSGAIDETNSRYRMTITPSSGNAQTIDIPFATTSSSGLMSSSDKTKLNGISASSTTPKMDGTAAVGTETTYARGNHVHPSDTSRVPTTRTVNGKALSGNIIIGPSDIASAFGVDTETLVDDAAYFEDALNNKANGNGRIFYGICSTAGIENVKEVTCSAYDSLAVGDIVIVHFENENIQTSLSTLKLNVNSTGAKSIKQIHNGFIENPTYYRNVNGTRIFIYDGTYWVVQSDDDAKYSTGTTSDIEAGTSAVDKVWTPYTLHNYIASVVGGVDAMRFKGTVNSNSDLPTTGVKVGDTYMVNTAGTYAGQTCEVGDLIIATATTPTWTVAQTNINGAVTASTTTSSGYLAKFTGNKIVANGPQLGSATTTYLRNDGTWATPPGTYTLPKASSSLGGIQAGTSKISAGSTIISTGLSTGSHTLYGIHAIDTSTDEEVIVDVIKDSNTIKFSINSAYEHEIKISYIYLTI